MCNKTKECSDHGTCGDDGKCLCQDGYFGHDCSSKLMFLKNQNLSLHKLTIRTVKLDIDAIFLFSSTKSSM